MKFHLLFFLFPLCCLCFWGFFFWLLFVCFFSFFLLHKIKSFFGKKGQKIHEELSKHTIFFFFENKRGPKQRDHSSAKRRSFFGVLLKIHHRSIRSFQFLFFRANKKMFLSRCLKLVHNLKCNANGRRLTNVSDRFFFQIFLFIYLFLFIYYYYFFLKVPSPQSCSKERKREKTMSVESFHCLHSVFEIVVISSSSHHSGTEKKLSKVVQTDVTAEVQNSLLFGD